MTFNIDGLHSLRDRKSSAKESWQPPRLDDFSDKHVIAFDQTLNTTAGMCVHREDDGLRVRSVTMFAGQSSASGDEGSLQKGVALYNQFVAFLMSMKGVHRHSGDFVVAHEAPPVGGGTVRRPESALLAAQVLRIACARLEIPVAPMVASSTHRKAVCGNHRADKAEAHRGLAELASTLPIHGYDRVTNEHKRDALCVAIAHLLRERRRGQ